MFSAVGLFLGLKSKISHEQNVIYFQFYVRLPNFRLLGSLIKKSNGKVEEKSTQIINLISISINKLLLNKNN